MTDLKACNDAFDNWYTMQRHQLSNEQVCRVIWQAAWNARREAMLDKMKPDAEGKS
jgi:hypothetical protein